MQGLCHHHKPPMHLENCAAIAPLCLDYLLKALTDSRDKSSLKVWAHRCDILSSARALIALGDAGEDTEDGGGIGQGLLDGVLAGDVVAGIEIGPGIAGD